MKLLKFTATALSVSAIASFAITAITVDDAQARSHPNTEKPSDKNFDVGVAKFKDGDYDGAVDAFLQSVYFARNNYQPAANLWLGKSYMMKNEDPKAIEALKKAMDQSLSGNVDAHLLLGEVYLRDGRNADAEKEATDAIAQTQGRAYQGYDLLARVYEGRQDYGSAQGAYENALGDQPWTFTAAWIGLAECMMKQKNWVGALQQFKALLNSPKILKGVPYEVIYLDIGICLLAKGDHQGAIDNWHKCLDYNTKNPDAHLQLGMLFDAENHLESAIKEYKEFVRDSTDQKKIDRAKERIRMLGQKLGPDEEHIMVPRPSPYMRQQYDMQQKRIEQQQQQQAVPKDSGF